MNNESCANGWVGRTGSEGLSFVGDMCAREGDNGAQHAQPPDERSVPTKRVQQHIFFNQEMPI